MGGLYSGQSSLGGSDRILADALRKSGDNRLAGYMSRGDSVRKVQFGVAGGLSRSEVRDVLEGLWRGLGYVGGESWNFDAWFKEQKKSLGETVSGRRLLQQR